MDFGIGEACQVPKFSLCRGENNGITIGPRCVMMAGLKCEFSLAT